MHQPVHADDHSPAPAPEDQQPMHVHKIKPVHGWREFLGEILIIVIGILIALGAEQVVERWHWQSKADETTALIRDEVRDNYGRAAEAASAAPCIGQQLAMLEAAIGKPGFTAAPSYSDGGSGHFVVRIPSRSWGDSVWNAATAEGTVSHLPVKIRQSLQDFYRQLTTMELNARQADVLAWRLRSLALPGEAREHARSIETIEELRGHVELMALIANQLMGRADTISMRPASDYLEDRVQKKSGTIKFCRLHGIAIGRPSPQNPT